MWCKYPFTRDITVFVHFFFQHSVMTNPTIFWTLLRSNAYEFVQDFCAFSVREKVEISSINAYAYFCGLFSPSTDFLIFNSLSTEPFNASLISEFMT